MNNEEFSEQTEKELDELINQTAKEILEKYRAAFEELAK